jgi:hypothetical protein
VNKRFSERVATKWRVRLPRTVGLELISNLDRAAVNMAKHANHLRRTVTIVSIDFPQRDDE